MATVPADSRSLSRRNTMPPENSWALDKNSVSNTGTDSQRTSSRLQRQDTSNGRGRALLKKMYSQDETSTLEQSQLNASTIQQLNQSTLTPPSRSKTLEERKRLVGSPAKSTAIEERKRYSSTQAVQKILERSKSSSALFNKHDPPPPLPSKIDFDEPPSEDYSTREKRLSSRYSHQQQGSSTLRKSRSMGGEAYTESASFLGQSPAVRRALAKHASAIEYNTGTSSGTASATASPARFSSLLAKSATSSSDRVRQGASADVLQSRMTKRHSSSASNSSSGGSRPSPIKNHLNSSVSSSTSSSSTIFADRVITSPTKRALLSSVLETSAEDLDDGGEEKGKVLHRLVSKRRASASRGAPSGMIESQQLPSPIEVPLASSASSSFTTGSPPPFGMNQHPTISSPLEGNRVPSPVKGRVDAITPTADSNPQEFTMSPVESQLVSPTKRRSLQRNNESAMSGSVLFRDLLPPSAPSLPSSHVVIPPSAFDEHPAPSSSSTLASLRRFSPEKQPIEPSSSMERPQSQRVTSKRLNRFSRSAPNNNMSATSELPPRPSLTRFKASKSPLKENLTGTTTTPLFPKAESCVAQTTTTDLSKPTPSQMRDLLRKTLMGESASVSIAEERRQKRIRIKEQRIVQFLDSPKELRGLAMEDGGFLKIDYRRNAWPCLLADASRKVPSSAQQSLNDSDTSLDESSKSLGSGAALVNEKDHHQIDLDVERKYDEGDLESRERLRKFLHAFFYNHPELCYFQGFHDLCALILKVFDEDLIADFVVYKISTQTIVRDAHRPTMDAIFAQLRAIFFIIECTDAELAEKLQSTIGTESFWAISMLTCLFAHDVADEASIERLVDTCIAGGPHFPLYLVASLALLPTTRRFLIECDHDETAVLGTLRQDARTIVMDDADELVRFAQILQRRVPPARVIDHCHRKLDLPLDSFLASRWLVKTSKWVFGSAVKVRDKPLGE